MKTNTGPILFSKLSILGIKNTRPGTWPPEPIDPSLPCKGVTRRISPIWLKRKPGDRLWVRENWQTGCKLDLFSPKQIAQKAKEAGIGSSFGHPACPIKYAADGQVVQWGENDKGDFGDWGKLRPIPKKRQPRLC
jgi:hypothetical protein